MGRRDPKTMGRKKQHMLLLESGIQTPLKSPGVWGEEEFKQ